MAALFTSDRCDSPDGCATCPGKVVCRCLQVTEQHLVHMVERLELRTLRDLREHTGAGDGCTCCHRALQEIIDRHALAAVG